MADAGLAVTPESVISVPTRRQNASLLPWEPEQAYRIAQEILRNPDRPDAIVMGKDHFALGLYHALDEVGMTASADMAVVGYGDYPYAAYLHPPLSSVHVPAEEVATTAVDLLLQRARSKEPFIQQRILLQPRLIVRESSSPSAGRTARTGATRFS
jgi:LacI family transcriptional regulator